MAPQKGWGSGSVQNEKKKKHQRKQISYDADQDATNVAISRLLIIHCEFEKACTGNSSLDENASTEELSEQILYYFSETTGEYSSPEAIKFAGLVSTLYSLPRAFAASSNDYHGNTKYVHLSNATIVFIPLEEDRAKNILAVAQIPRSRSFVTSTESPEEFNGVGGDQLAIRKSIQQSHFLFCLLRGGGIHMRLSTFNDDEEKQQNGRLGKIPLYPGMGRLYSLRRQKRRLRKQLVNMTLSDGFDPKQSEAIKTGKEYEAVEDELSRLQPRLPINSLRLDLKYHYDGVLAERGLVANIGGSANRCIVDCIPPPVSMSSGCCVRQLSSISSIPHLECGINNIVLGKSINNSIRNDQVGSNLLAISSFYRGQLMYSHVTLDPTIQTSSNQQDQERFFVCPVAANLIMRYMQRNNVNAHNLTQYSVPSSQISSHESSGSFTPPRNRKLDSFKSFVSGSLTPPPPPRNPKLGGFSRFGENSVTPNTSGNITPTETESVNGSFLMTPPLSMLSASDTIFKIYLPSLGHDVWTPKVFLPCYSRDTGCDESKDGGNNSKVVDVIEAHAALYEGSEFSFLLYFTGIYAREVVSNGDDLIVTKEREPQTQARNRSSQVISLSNTTALMLESIAISLSLVLDSVSNSYRNTEDFQTKFVPEVGQDIIYVNRREHKLHLLTTRNPTAQSREGKAGAKPERKVNKRIAMNLFGFKRSIGQKQQQEFKLDVRDGWQSLGLDCRHLLAYHLPLDVILGFDDAINEIHNSYQFGSDHRPIKDSGIELCTFLPQGWMYSYVFNDQELYIYFDAGAYVTIADVESSALRVRQALMDERQSVCKE